MDARANSRRTEGANTPVRVGEPCRPDTYPNRFVLDGTLDHPLTCREALAWNLASVGLKECWNALATTNVVLE